MELEDLATFNKVIEITASRPWSKEAVEFSRRYDNLVNTDDNCIFTWLSVDNFFGSRFGEECEDREMEQLFDSLEEPDKIEVMKMVS